MEGREKNTMGYLGGNYTCHDRNEYMSCYPYNYAGCYINHENTGFLEYNRYKKNQIHLNNLWEIYGKVKMWWLYFGRNDIMHS